MKKARGWHPPIRHTKPPSLERPRDPASSAVHFAAVKRERRAQRMRQIAERGGIASRA